MLLDRKIFFVKEQIEFLKLAGTYDIFDPDTNIKIGVAKEEPGALIKFLKLFIDKRVLPTKVNVYDNESGEIVISMKKPITFIRSKVVITGRNGSEIGYFKSKLFSFGGGFKVYNNGKIQFADVKGDWKGWDFKLLTMTGSIIGTITKKWAGLGKELFTSADNYMLSLNEETDTSDTDAALLIASGLAIDIIYKEGR
jgi:uncharacterized protein YxjI